MMSGGNSGRRLLLIALAVALLFAAGFAYLYLASTRMGNNELVLEVGNPKPTFGTFTNVNSSSTYLIEEDIPITVYANDKTNVTLAVGNIPLGVWARFYPTTITGVTSAGKNGMLEIAGAEEPAHPTKNNVTMTVSAISDGGGVVTVGVPILGLLPLSILQYPGPISLGSPNSWVIGENGTSFSDVGVIYDPFNKSVNELPVNITAAGMLVDGKVRTFPNWLVASVPIGTFTLRPLQPYYFQIEAKAIGAAPGTYILVFNERIANRLFVTSVDIKVLPPIRA